MRKFSFRPAFALRGREFRGLRGFAGKPFHPPLTDIPVAAYVFAAAFDVISYLGKSHTWAHDFYRAGSFVLLGGAMVSVFTALTGFWDWLKSTEKGTQARRTANAHAWTMIAVTLVVLVDLAMRYGMYWTTPHAPGRVAAVSVLAALITVVGAWLGGELVFEHGFNVEMVGEVWEKSEQDVFPGKKKD